MSNRWKITYADGSTNNIIADEDFCKKITSDGDSYEAIVPEPLHEDAVRIHAEHDARMWRNSQLEQTDKFVSLTDHPNHSAIMAYRVALRDWPGTDSFPSGTKPTLGS